MWTERRTLLGTASAGSSTAVGAMILLPPQLGPPPLSVEFLAKQDALFFHEIQQLS